MPAEKIIKNFLSIAIPIAYDSRSTVVSSGTRKCSFEKWLRRARRLPTSIFDAVAHFVCLGQEWQPSPTGGPGHASRPITTGVSCTCPLPACLWVCSATPHPQPITAHPPLQLQSEANGAAVAFNEKSPSVLMDASPLLLCP